MDLLAALPQQLPVIVPSTVIRETRHRSLPLFNRLQQFVQEEDRSVWVWWNEECRDTATAGLEEEGESINDRNDRGELTRPVYAKLTASHPPDTSLLSSTPVEHRADTSTRSTNGRQAESRTCSSGGPSIRFSS